MRGALALAVLLPLAACGGAGDPGALGFVSPGVNKGAPLTKAQFYRGAVVVAGPAGYCIDPRTVRNRSTGSFGYGNCVTYDQHHYGTR